MSPRRTTTEEAMKWDRIKAGAAVLWRAFVAGAIGGVSTYVTSNGLPIDLHAAARTILFTAAGGGIAAAAIVVEQWLDPHQVAFGRHPQAMMARPCLRYRDKQVAGSGRA
jgi:hypothetical protein